MPANSRLLLAAIPLALAVLVSVFGAACGGARSQAIGVTVEPIASATPAGIRIGGKPAAPASDATARPAATATETAGAVDEPPQSEAGEATPEPSPTPTPYAADGSTPPADGRWIDVDVRTLAVRLMDGSEVVQDIAPVAVGAELDTGNFASTQTGLFHVYNKVEELAYDPPYDTYLSHWVGFDLDRQNGFHSFLKDEAGNVVDDGTGRISNGCIRTPAAEAVYAFAEIGMPVWVHW